MSDDLDEDDLRLPIARTRAAAKPGSKVEQACVAWAKKRGWYCIKIAKTEIRGRPDRLFLREGRYVWVEFKGEHETVTPLQKKSIADINAHGGVAWVCRDETSFRERMF